MFDADAWAAQWAVSPGAAVEALYAEPDPLIQVDRVERIVMSHPELTPALCPALRDGPAQARCEQHLRRPHLWTPTPEHQQVRLSETLTDAAAEPAPCPDGRDADACANRQALEHARHGRTAQAAAVCRAISAETWQKECLFRAAEHRMLSPDPGRYAEAVSLCAATADFTASCLGHLNERIVPDIPSALAGARAWRPVTRAARQIRNHWRSRDPGLGTELEGRFWESVLRHALVNSPVLTGDLLDHLPPEAHPHVRAMLALRFAEQLPAPPARFDALQAGFAAVLAARGGEAPPPAGRPEATVSYPDLWQPPGAAESIEYLSDSRRPVSPDVAVDQLLALLSASARVWPASRGLLEEASAHPSPLVSGEAARLLAR